MSYTTYSFADVSVIVRHPSFGQYIAAGEGIGNITVAMTTTRTIQDVAADGNIMISKVKGRNGNITLQIQQTSSFHKWLLKLYNYVEAAAAGAWAGASIVIRSPQMQDLITCTGVAFQKLPDRPYQADGQKVSWVLMAADVQQDIA